MSKKKWLTLLSISGSLLLAACEDEAETTEEETTEVAESEEDTESQEDSTEEVESEEEEEEEVDEPEDSGLLTVGDSITIDDITMTVTGAEFVDERNEFADEEPDNVIAIHYTLENDSEDDYPYGLDFDVYVDGSQSDTYPNDNSMGSVSSGRSVDGVAHYGINGEQIEVEWEPMFSFSNEKGIWDITPE